MKNSKIVKHISSFDLHDERASKWAIYVCLGLLIVLSLLVRKSLIEYQSGDLAFFFQWYGFVKIHGIHSFKYGYSNYNPPYTYFLYLSTFLPLSKIAALKSIMFLFDIVMAVGVYFLVKVFRPKGYIPLIAAITAMYLPTVLVTGVMWGQFDQFYTAFILLSMASALRNNSRWAWIWFGVSIAIKFQAIFFLPLLIIVMFRRIRWYDAIWAVVSFLVLTLPPLLAGRSLHSLLNIYPAESKVGQGLLNLNAPNVWQWFPDSTFPYVYHLGIGVAIAACIFILLFTLIHQKFTKQELLICATLILYVVPFFLPEMHERYFFPAGIMSMVLAFAYPNKTFIGIAVLIQVVTLFSYSPFLFGTTPIPFSILSATVLLIICLLTGKYFTTSGEPTRPKVKLVKA